MGLSGEEEAHLREEIDRRIKAYAARGLNTKRIRDVLHARGVVAVLEEYATSEPDRVTGWKALVKDEPELTLEWLVLNDPAARRETSEAAHEAASWKLSKPSL